MALVPRSQKDEHSDVGSSTAPSNSLEHSEKEPLIKNEIKAQEEHEHGNENHEHFHIQAPDPVFGVTTIRDTFLFHRHRWLLVVSCCIALTALFFMVLMRCLEEEFESLVTTFAAVCEWLPSLLVLITTTSCFLVTTLAKPHWVVYGFVGYLFQY